MREKLTDFVREYRGLIISFIAALWLVVDLVLMVIKWEEIWSKVFGGIFNFLFSLTEIFAFVCMVLVVCCVILVITALFYCTFYEDKDIAKEKERESNDYQKRNC